MNFAPQTKKSGIHVIAGLIFLLNAISYGLMLFIPIIEDGFDDFDLSDVVSLVTFAAFAIIAVTFLAGVGKAASAMAFGLLAAADITMLVRLFTSDYFKYVKFMSYFPTILMTVAFLFAIAICQAGAKRTPSTGPLKLWFVPGLVALVAGVIEFVNGFDSFKKICQMVFKRLGDLGGAMYALYYVATFVYYLMYLLFPIGLLAGMFWVYKTAGSAPAYSAPYAGYVPQQTQSAYSSYQQTPGYVPAQPSYTPPQPSYTPPQQSYTPPQPSYTPPQPAPEPEIAHAPERRITGYDSMTGQPIYEEAAKKIVGYDSMTGQPIYED